MAAKSIKGLVIVESPAKAKKIGDYLGKDYIVKASMGHVRDLPNSAEDFPAELKKEPWVKKWAVNVDRDFEPLYIVPKERKKVVKELKDALKQAQELILATDEDREGESIGWHLTQLLAPKVPVKRMVFSEITKKAILDALSQTRQLDESLVQAQETRRVLDRLYGYEVSPVLWRKVRQGLSAGRVQSVATRLVVQRERERMAFVKASYWDVEGDFTPDGAAQQFTARLTTVDGSRVAAGRDYSDRGELVGKHRKLVPTAMERLIWGQGDGSTLPAMQTDAGRIGAAICWENMMPLLRTAMYAKGLDVWCAPTVDERDMWQVSMRHIAYEGRLFVVSACQYQPPPTASAAPDWPRDRPLIRGGSIIVSPLGEVLAGPVYNCEELVVAKVDLFAPGGDLGCADLAVCQGHGSLLPGPSPAPGPWGGNDGICRCPIVATKHELG